VRKPQVIDVVDFIKAPTTLLSFGLGEPVLDGDI
jgi:hypothetical protein